MIIPGTNLVKRNHSILMIFGTILLVMSHVPAFAQEKPKKPIEVTVSPSQHLSFGTFIQSGTSGTVTVSAQGGRTATGSVILSNISSIVTPALFEVKAHPHTLITIVNGPYATLTGSNEGTLTLHIGDSDPQSPFTTKSAYTTVTIGGTLIVGSLLTNPEGVYSGTFTVTFIEQ
ncbi:MAG: DUF4402 domain-containing protein [Bacteroidales bacterium]